jgi:hypothetical protein
LNKGKICYKSKLIKHSGNAVMTIKTFTSTTTLEKLRSKDNVRWYKVITVNKGKDSMEIGGTEIVSGTGNVEE